jgi:hypothetical protein
LALSQTVSSRNSSSSSAVKWFAFRCGIGRLSQRGKRPLPLVSVPAGISGSATTGKRKAMAVSMRNRDQSAAV